MIIVEEQHDEESKRNRGKDPIYLEVPEIYQPGARLSGVKSPRYRHSADVGTFQVAWNVCKADPEQCSYLHFVSTKSSAGKRRTQSWPTT